MTRERAESFVHRLQEDRELRGQLLRTKRAYWRAVTDLGAASGFKFTIRELREAQRKLIQDKANPFLIDAF